MPFVWTHLLFGESVYKKANLPTLKNPKHFYLGTQGPDFLFFYRFLPWQDGSQVNKLGSQMHRKNCGPFLLDLIQAANQKPSLREYTLGFITHHLLDRTTHPYIHYRAGFKKYRHQKLEVLIDTIVAKQLKGIETWCTPVYERINIGPHFPSEWVETLTTLTTKHYPEDVARFPKQAWNTAYRDMLRALRLFFDPWGIKNILTAGQIAPFRYPRSIPPKDYLNEQKSEWLHPAIPEEKRKESFWDLWEQAHHEAVILIKKVNQYWREEEKLHTLQDFIGNISYDTGKECDLKLTNRVADPIV